MGLCEARWIVSISLESGEWIDGLNKRKMRKGLDTGRHFVWVSSL